MEVSHQGFDILETLPLACFEFEPRLKDFCARRLDLKGQPLLIGHTRPQKPNRIGDGKPLACRASAARSIAPVSMRART